LLKVVDGESDIVSEFDRVIDVEMDTGWLSVKVMDTVRPIDAVAEPG
jgi:hypothetical protein